MFLMRQWIERPERLSQKGSELRKSKNILATSFVIVLMWYATFLLKYFTQKLCFVQFFVADNRVYGIQHLQNKMSLAKHLQVLGQTRESLKMFYEKALPNKLLAINMSDSSEIFL